jgi:hypothetical protein
MRGFPIADVRRYLPLPDTGRASSRRGEEDRFPRGGAAVDREKRRFCLSDVSARATPAPRSFAAAAVRDVRRNAPRGSSRMRKGGRVGVEGGRRRRRTAEEGGCAGSALGVVAALYVGMRERRTQPGGEGGRRGGREVRRGRRLVPNSAH